MGVTPYKYATFNVLTNAISSVIIVGAIIAGLAGNSESVFNFNYIRFSTICLAAINIFGGFGNTKILAMYKKRKG